jgi:hypothetical protein
MDFINEANIILGKDAFSKQNIEKMMAEGGFKSISKFELFIWDLEIMLQLQRVLGDNIILKGGAATQFYLPVNNQRTSIDIDLICKASHEEVGLALQSIEDSFAGQEEYLKFRKHIPKNSKVSLDYLETYFVTVPTICSGDELLGSRGKQEVKVEFLFLEGGHRIQKIKSPNLFALTTGESFNILSFEQLFSDKLTTIGPNTIGVPFERSDEQLKQVYDVITLFLNNSNEVIRNPQKIRFFYKNTAIKECQMRKIEYNKDVLFADMMKFTRKLQQIENDPQLYKIANDFQSVYLRSSVTRDKNGWAIVGFQLELLFDFIFNGNDKILRFREIENLISSLSFPNITGPERGSVMREVRTSLETKFSLVPDLSNDFFRKSFGRIIWELVTKKSYEDILECIKDYEKVAA